MVEFTVNGKLVSAKKSQKLIIFLRDELKLTSVKDGCSQGACGTCMVLIDGKAQKACIPVTDKMEGKQVVTVEGLTPREKQVYSYAFAQAGAVQCGFCIPGMVISAKGLLDQEADPTRLQVKEAIKNNICRCTGYLKIEEAILLAAKLLREDTPIPDHDFTGQLGERLLRVDAAAKTMGTAEYADDIYLDGMLYGGALRSAYPRAKVLSLDVSAARALPGVSCVVTAAELPGKPHVGHLKKDQKILIGVGEVTTYLGDAIALIAADSRETLAQAKKLIQVEYEELPGVFSIDDAKAEGAPWVHEDGNLLSHVYLKRGDADEKIKNSTHVVTVHYSTPPTEHAFLEPETAVAMPEGDGVLIYSGDQGIYQTLKECSEATGLPTEKVRVVAKMVGGGFGGKEDMSVQHHAAVLALAAKKPVKFSMSRDESILCHPKRHAMEIEMTTACDENGYLTAMKAVIHSDTGAFASLGGPVLQRACTHAAGPYNYQDIEIDGKAWYTNNPPAGAFRGFGVPQSCFATECNLNLLAEKVGLTPYEIRYRNAIRPGQTLPNGQIADDSTALVETLEAVKPYLDAHPKAGIACAMKNSGLGVGVPDIGRCRLLVEDDMVQIHTSAACIGQGIGTVVTQMVCETTGLPLEKVRYCTPDTSLAPDCGNTTASRQTVFAGEATRRACLALLEAKGEGPLEALNGQDFFGEYVGETDKLGSDKEHPISHVAYGYATHLVDLDEDGMICKVIAAHDVGRAINPTAVEGQIHGGVVMSLGYSLTEDFPLNKGKPTAKFGTLGLMKSTQIPDIEAVIVEKPLDELAYGAKGIGEICSIPTPPAVQLAYYNRDGKFRTSLPLEDTPYSRRKK